MFTSLPSQDLVVFIRANPNHKLRIVYIYYYIILSLKCYIMIISYYDILICLEFNKDCSFVMYMYIVPSTHIQ